MWLGNGAQSRRKDMIRAWNEAQRAPERGGKERKILWV